MVPHTINYVRSVFFKKEVKPLFLISKLLINFSQVTSIVLILSFLFATPYLAVGPATSKQALPEREGSDFFNSSHSNNTTPFLHGIESTPSILYQLTSSSHVGNTSNFQEDNNLER